MAARSTGGPLTALELDAWRGFLYGQSRLQRELDREMTEAEGFGLTSYEVLLRLASAPGKRMRMGDIADSLVLSRSGLTGIISQLERQGYVARERACADGRGIEAVLTKLGQSVFRRAHRVHLAGVRRYFLSHLTDEQLHQLTTAWTAIGIVGSPHAESDAQATT
jgi:DNA-binding MarR family transcriptional regulator